MQAQARIPTNSGYSYKNYRVTGIDTNSSKVTVTVSATCKWSAIIEARKLGIARTLEVKV